MLDLIIKVHLPNVVSILGQSCRRVPTNHECLLWTLVTFYVLHLTIKITVVIPPYTKHRPNVVIIVSLHRRQLYSIKPKESQVNVFTWHTECASL